MTNFLEAIEALASLKISYDFLVAKDKRFKDERTEKDLNVLQEYIHENKQNEKKLKAFEIIKEKGVNVYSLTWVCLEHNSTYEQYVDDFNYADGLYDLGKELLTIEEYEFLKEVLLWN